MELTRYLKELLYQYECVTVPGFGAFLTHQKNIVVNRFTGEFTPPTRELSFNRLIQNNDGVLANYIARQEKISYAEALTAIEQQVERWQKQSLAHAVVLPGIGELTTNAEDKLRFIPYGKLNFDPNALGLQSFTRAPVKEQLKVAAVVPPISPKSTPKPSNTMQNDNKEPLAFTPETQEKKSGLRYAIIGVLAVSLLGATYYFGNQYLESEREKSTELAQKRIAKNVREATFDLGAIASLELDVPAVIETVANESSVSIASGQFYSVIAGSFREQANAERKLASLKDEGFDAAFAEQSPDGLYRVAYARFSTKGEAYSLLNFVNTTVDEQAWYLVEGF